MYFAYIVWKILKLINNMGFMKRYLEAAMVK